MAGGVDSIGRISVLDLVPVRTDQSSRHALVATVQLTQTANQRNFSSRLVVEDYSMLSVGATSPPVLITYLAVQTTRIELLGNLGAVSERASFNYTRSVSRARIDLG